MSDMTNTSAVPTVLTGGWRDAYTSNASPDLWGQEPMPIVPLVVERAAELGLETAIDLGCGDGRNLLALQRGGLAVAGLDIAPEALARTDARLRRGGSPAHLVVGDVTALPFASASVDLVTALDVAGQIPEPTALLAEAARVLRPGGLFVANFFDLSDSTYGEGEPIGEHAFEYFDTLFRYYERSAVEALFEGWDAEFQTVRWVDQPHGVFRPTAHEHVNHVVFAQVPVDALA